MARSDTGREIEVGGEARVYYIHTYISAGCILLDTATLHPYSAIPSDQ